MTEGRDVQTNQANTGVSQDLLFITTIDVFVIDGLACLAINPADVKRAVLEATVEMLDVTHHPSHFNTTLDGKFASRLHLPAGTRASPGANFSKSSHDGDFVEVNKSAQIGHIT